MLNCSQRGEPIGSHELFGALNSLETLEGTANEESDLKYLRVIEEIRDSNPVLFEQIKRLPKKARSAKQDNLAANSLISYFRREKTSKVLYSSWRRYSNGT